MKADVPSIQHEEVEDFKKISTEHEEGEEFAFFVFSLKQFESYLEVICSHSCSVLMGEL